MEATPAQVQRKLYLISKCQQMRDASLSRENKDFYEEICQFLADWLEKYEVPYRYNKETKQYVEVKTEETPLEVISQSISELLARLPEGYISSHELAFNTKTKMYHLLLLPEHTLVFKEASGKEAIERTRRYVAEREGYPTLPVGVINGIYD